MVGFPRPPRSTQRQSLSVVKLSDISPVQLYCTVSVINIMGLDSCQCHPKPDLDRPSCDVCESTCLLTTPQCTDERSVDASETCEQCVRSDMIEGLAHGLAKSHNLTDHSWGPATVQNLTVYYLTEGPSRSQNLTNPLCSVHAVAVSRAARVH